MSANVAFARPGPCGCALAAASIGGGPLGASEQSAACLCAAGSAPAAASGALPGRAQLLGPAGALQPLLALSGGGAARAASSSAEGAAAGAAAGPARGLRILLLAPFAPRPDAHHGGGRALAALLAALAARHEVALLYARAPDEPPLDAALAGACALAEEVARPLPAAAPGPRWARRARLAAGLALGRPTLATDWLLPGVGRRLAALLATWRPDILQTEFTLMGQHLPAGGGPPRVLTIHEPGAAGARQRLGAARGPGRLAAGLELLAWERFERRVLARADAAVVFTEEDRRALAPVAGPTRVVRIPLGVAVPDAPLSGAGAGPTVLFVGSFVHWPNVEAAERLIRAIGPLVWAARPDARLLIVGDAPPERLRRLAGERVQVTGQVPSVTPYLDAAAVVAAPLRLGGGMRVKVLEALAAGKAVVASPLAAAGLPVRSGEELLLADDDGAFAAALLALLGDPARRAALGARAYTFARARLSWERTADAYSALYARLLAPKLGEPPMAPFVSPARRPAAPVAEREGAPQ
jgi:glycosyltransferase involved in cell wall biosynthesis